MPAEELSYASPSSRARIVLDLELERDARAAGHVRAVLREIATRVPEAFEYDVFLLLTEVVNNAVLYGASTIHVEVRLDPEAVRVTVTNRGPAFRWLADGRPDPADVGGRGLLLVDALASACGVERGDGTNTVWFEVSGAAS